MKQTFSLNFACRAQKANKKGLSPVELTICINGTRVFMALPRKEDPEEFKKLMSAKKNNDLKTFTSNYLTFVNSKISEMVSHGLVISASSVKDYIINGYCSVYTVGQLISDYMKLCRGRNMSYGTYRKYEIASEYLLKYVKKTDSVEKIDNFVVLQIQNEFKKVYTAGTLANYMTKLKSFILFAMQNGKMKVNPWQGIRVHKPEGRIEWLSDSELEVMERKPMSERLSQVRDCFLFQCYTALSYCDMASFRKEDLKDCDFGKYISKPRGKTGVTYTVLVNKKAIDILEKYDYKLPVLSNQKYNSYLGEIEVICNISKHLHSHLARHTAATYWLNHGVPLEVVSKCLGHTSTKMTQVYARLLDNTIFKELSKI